MAAAASPPTSAWRGCTPASARCASPTAPTKCTTARSRVWSSPSTATCTPRSAPSATRSCCRSARAEAGMAIVLDDELKGLINGALAAGAPLIVASVDAEGRPRLTFRGSLQAIGDDRVGFWARNAEGATMANIAANPHVAMMYRNAQTRVVLQLSGRARVAAGAERDLVYN